MLRLSRLSPAVIALWLVAFAFAAAGSALAQSDDDVASSPDCSCNGYKQVPNLAGDYAGTLDDANNGTGTLMISVSQHRRKLVGNWATSFENGQSDTGEVTGLVSQKTVKIILHTSNSKCHYQAIATIGSDNLQGAMISSRQCTDDNSGSFTINRQ